MKKITVILFLLSFLMMSFSKNIVMMDFYINQDAIAAKYCINKKRPQMHCNGHCFLMRQLKKEQQQETKNLGDQFSKIEVVSSKNHFPQLPTSSIVTTSDTKKYPDYSFDYSEDISLLVFKPPCA